VWASNLDLSRFPALVSLAKSGECRPFGQLAKEVRQALRLAGLPKPVQSVLLALDEAVAWCENPDLVAYWREDGADVGFDDEEGE
jgi:hypothetical protein